MWQNEKFPLLFRKIKLQKTTILPPKKVITFIQRVRSNKLLVIVGSELSSRYMLLFSKAHEGLLSFNHEQLKPSAKRNEFLSGDLLSDSWDARKCERKTLKFI